MKTVLALAAAAHPFPLAMVLLLTALIALASSDGQPPAGRLLLLLAAMLGSQLAIGWSNDYLDRDADAVYQPAKPLAAGRLDARLLPPLIALALAGAAVAGVALGLAPLLLLVAGTCCGLAYNLGLKATRYSAVPFVLAFVLLPPFVWTALDVYRDGFLALYPIALPLPVAAHVANVLPDLEGDRAQGRRTIAVVLGRGRAVLLTLACLVAPLVLVAISTLWLDYDAAWLLPAVAVHATAAAVAAALYALRPGRAAEAGAFRLIAAGAVVFAGAWLTAV